MKNSIEQLMIDNFCCCDTKSNKVADEHHRKFEIKSKEKNFVKITIDNCLIKDNDKEKCDFLFIRDYLCQEDKTEFYFVELKGQKVEKAFTQLITTIEEIKKKHLKGLKKEKIWGFIVSSKVPKAGISTTDLVEKFRKKYGKMLQVKNETLIYTPQ